MKIPEQIEQAVNNAFNTNIPEMMEKSVQSAIQKIYEPNTNLTIGNVLIVIEYDGFLLDVVNVFLWSFDCPYFSTLIILFPFSIFYLNIKTFKLSQIESIKTIRSIKYH